MRKITHWSLPVLVLCWLMLLVVRPAMASCTIDAPTVTAPMPLLLNKGEAFYTLPAWRFVRFNSNYGVCL